MEIPKEAYPLAKARYRKRITQCHPDTSGSPVNAAVELNAAIEAAEQELR